MTDTQLARATISIREMILRGSLKGGQRVAEAMLAEALGMSRTPIRQALPLLAREGLLVESGTRGYVVRTFTRSDILDAIDVRGFRLADGREINLTDISAARDLRAKIRASACARFSTVLGPGSDGYHEEHIHLDLAERHNGYKLCQWELREPPPPAQAESAPPADDASEQAEQAAAITASEVPLPRPRPLAANLTGSRGKKSETK